MFGGDGTASDAAFALWKSGVSVPLLCVGVGSTNAGSLIVEVEDLLACSPESLKPVPAGGLVARAENRVAGIGFNDVVVGSTVLATLGERVVQVDAARFIGGELVPSLPWSVGDGGTEVLIRRGSGGVTVLRGGFGELFVGLVDERYRGKGVAGGVSLTSALQIPAALALVDKPIVRYDLRVEELFELEPITVRSVSIKEADVVCIKGVCEGACLNVDGRRLQGSCEAVW